MTKIAIVLAAMILCTVPAFAADLILQWDAPTTNSDGTPITNFDKGAGKADYKVYQGTTPGGPYPVVIPVVGNATGTTVFTVTGLTDGTKYCFTASAIKTTGRESVKSNEACSTATVAPAAPLLLRFQ